MSRALSHFRQVLRAHLRHPGFALVAVLTLGVGIGANVAIFSVVDGVLLEPLPFREPERLVQLWHTAPGLGIPQFEQARETYVLYRRESRSFSGLGLYDDIEISLTAPGRPEQVAAAVATSSLFSTLGVEPALGRTFTAEEEGPDGPEVAVLSHGLWSRRFGADPGVLGQSVEVYGRAREVVGVMPEGFRFPGEETELWLPLVIELAELPTTSFGLYAVGRLAPGVSPEQAEAELSTLFRRLPEAFPGGLTAKMMEEGEMRARVHQLREDVVGEVEAVLWVLLGTVGFVLLIACANVANLFLVRAEGRRQEMAVRTALGAGRAALARHFLGESLALSLVGGVVGVALAGLGVRGLVALRPAEIPRLAEVGVDARVLVFAAAASLLAGFLFGLVAVVKHRPGELLADLREGGRGGSSGVGTLRTRNLLVAGQVALATVLLVASGLMTRTFRELRSVDPGFAAEDLLTLRLSLPSAGYPEAEDVLGFYHELNGRLAALPGVQRVGSVDPLPLTDGESNNGLLVEDRPLPPGSMPEIVRTVHADPGYFEAAGIPLLGGRGFERADLEVPRDVVVVSRSLAQRLWPGEEAVGKRVAEGIDPEQRPTWATVVGVVGDVRDSGLEAPADEMVYFSTYAAEMDGERYATRTRTVLLRTSVPPASLAPQVRAAVQERDPKLPVIRLRTGEEMVRASMARTAFATLLLGIAAAVALLLGNVGLYGVVAYAVTQRTREIGLRMALGARPRDVLRMVVGHSLRVAAAGALIGVAAALSLTGLLSSLLYGVQARDPVTFLGVPALLLAVSLLASWLPAHRASRVPPLEALRVE